MNEKEPPVLFDVSGPRLFPAPVPLTFQQTQRTDHPSATTPSLLSSKCPRLPNLTQTVQRSLTASHGESPC